MVYRARQAGFAGNRCRGHGALVRDQVLHTRVVRTSFKLLQFTLFHACLHLRLSDCSVARIA